MFKKLKMVKDEADDDAFLIVQEFLKWKITPLEMQRVIANAFRQKNDRINQALSVNLNLLKQLREAEQKERKD